MISRLKLRFSTQKRKNTCSGVETAATESMKSMCFDFFFMIQDESISMSSGFICG